MLTNEPVDEETRRRLAEYLQKEAEAEAKIEHMTRWSKFEWLKSIGFFRRYF